MRLHSASCLVFVTGMLCVPSLAQVSVQGTPYGVIPQRPTTLAAEPGNPDRLYAPNKLGRVYLLEGGVLQGEFLDITGQVNSNGESGMLGMALHPDYANNGKFYLSYTTGPGFGDSVLSEFTVSATDPNVADPTSEQIIFGPWPQTTDGHKAGDLHFGPDGMLYYALGDGWAGGANVDQRAQDLGNPLGSILRLDVDAPFPHVAAGNPYIGVAGADERIWALGLRNPYRMGVDSLNGDLVIGDVGQSTWEELNWVPGSTTPGAPGANNFGWPCKEGADCYGAPPVGCNCLNPDFEDPAVQYNHDFDCAVIAGTTYRGSAIPALQGYHVFTDFCSSRIQAVQIVDGVQVGPILDLTPQLGLITGIGAIVADSDGELYIVQHYSGSITKILPDFGTTVYCTANPNSTGAEGQIAALGSLSVTDNTFSLVATDLPPGQFAYFLTSRDQGFFPNIGSSEGNLCLTGTIGRYNALVGAIDASGSYSRSLDLTQMPLTPTVAAMAGETWNFQGWHRDAIPQPTSNFTLGLEVVFAP